MPKPSPKTPARTMQCDTLLVSSILKVESPGVCESFKQFEFGDMHACSLIS